MVLPYTRSAVIGGVFLGLGRALGETMAVTFVLGNAHELSASLLMPGNSIAATIANEFTEADSDDLPLVADRAGLRAVPRHLHRAGHRQLMLLRSSTSRRAVTERWRPRCTPPRRANLSSHVACDLAATAFGLFWLVWILWTTLRNGPGRDQPGAVHADDAAAGRTAACSTRSSAAPDDRCSRVADRHADRRRWPAPTSPNTRSDTRVAERSASSTTSCCRRPRSCIGLFVYTLVVRTSGHFSGFAGALALALIVLPVVVRTTDEMLQLVPDTDARSRAFARACRSGR